MMNSLSRIIVAFAFIALDPGLAVAAGGTSGPAHVRAAISATYDKPGAKVQTDPVVIVGDHAVADWIQGRRGGRALLRRNHDKWEIVLCAGEALTHGGTLVQAGVPPSMAQAIEQKLAQAEKGVPASRRQKFDLFGTTSDSVAGAHSAHPDHRHQHLSEPKL